MATVEKLIDAGWAVALVNTGAIQMDNGAGLHEGIIGLMNEGKDRKPDDWGVLAAWSWGLSRVLDYFEKDNSHQRQTDWYSGTFALGQNRPAGRCAGPALGHCVFQLLGFDGGFAGKTKLRRND